MQAPFQAGRELSPFPAAPLVRDELPYRLRQQSLLGELGRIAMQTRDFRQILQHATELCAEGLPARFAKVLEYLPDEKRLIVRPGVRWAPGTIDIVSLAADIESPAGFAYQTGQTVISNHLEAETCFRTPQLLSAHGVKRAINVLIEKGGDSRASLNGKAVCVGARDPSEATRQFEALANEIKPRRQLKTTRLSLGRMP
jgi:two-component system, sensor histidine kinase PdtaS